MAARGQHVGYRLWWGFILPTLLLCACSLLGQTTATDKLTGKLTDTYLKPLSRATIVVHNTETGAEARTVTREDGSFHLKGLESGEYTLDAESPALGRGQLGEIAVSTGHEARVVAALTMVLPTAPLEVAQATLQDQTPTTPIMNTTVTGEQLHSLPVSGRQWQNFALDTPTANIPHENPNSKGLDGTGLNPGATSEGSGLRGVSGVQATTMVEGMNATPGFKSRGWGRGMGAPMAEAAIEHVEAQAGNGEIESSHSPSGKISAATRRGENGLHGQVFYYDRGNIWGAHNPFTQIIEESAPASTPFPGTTLPTFTPTSYTPQDIEMTWGLGIGGHLRRKKIFWFVAADGYDRNNPAVSSARHADLFFGEPTACGLNTPCPVGFQDLMQVLAARLDLSSANPFVEGVSAYSGMLTTLAGLLGPTPRSAKQGIAFARLDWLATERDHLTIEGNGALWNAPNGALTRTAETYGNHSYGNARASEEWGLGRWEHFVTADLLAVTQASWSREILHQTAGPSSAYEQTLMANVWGRVPQIVVDSRDGFIIGTPAKLGTGSYPDERRIEANEQVDWVHRNHLMKAGFEFEHTYDMIGVLLNQNGTYHYSSVYNFISDALSYADFGINGQLNPLDQHNCDETGKVWRDSGGGLRGLGYLPCYTYYSQTMGPVGRALSTNDWAAYVTEQWQPRKRMTVSAALRWQREQLPSPIASLVNSEIPGTEHLPQLGNEWAPRVSMAWAVGNKEWPVVRFGYGMYYGRTENATIETALTHTGSLNGDLNFFVRPIDNLHNGGAPPFPYVFAGLPVNVVKPGAVEFAPHFRNPEVHQMIASVEEKVRGDISVTGSLMLSLGRRLPISIDTNFSPAPVNPQTITYAIVDGSGKGPIKSSNITVPFYASWPSVDCGSQLLNLAGQCGRANPDYQQITQITSKANSTYEAFMLKVTRTVHKGVSFHAHYIYSHATDWNPNETTLVAGSDVLDPDNFGLEYGTSDLDVRHVFGATVEWLFPWKLTGLKGKALNGWHAATVGQFRSGRPYTMRTSGQLATEINSNGTAIVGLAPGMNGSGGDNRIYGIGRNTYRYPATWKDDLRLSKRINFGGLRELELIAESFNLFNHQNVTELETVGYTIESGTSDELPRLNFLTGLKPNTTAFGQPLNVNATNFYRPRQFELGARMRF